MTNPNVTEEIKPMDFVAALKIADGVFEKYKQDQPKWWKVLDGTPILNDIAVRMAMSFMDEAQKAWNKRAG